jgi:hypothetical protein
MYDVWWTLDNTNKIMWSFTTIPVMNVNVNRGEKELERRDGEKKRWGRERYKREGDERGGEEREREMRGGEIERG